MQSMRQRILSCALIMLCILLLRTPHAAALSAAYDQSFDAAYMSILQRMSDTEMELQGYARNLVVLFQDRRIDAVGVYDFQAEHFLRGTSEELYWYPHFTATVIFAVWEDAPMPVTDWADLKEDVTIVLPEKSPEREIFLLALAQEMFPADEPDAAFARFARMKEEGRLRFYPPQTGILRDFKEGRPRDVYILFAHEADRLIRRGARLQIVIPESGTLAFPKGLLSRTPITFAPDLSEQLAAAGYPGSPHPGGAVRTVSIVPRAICTANEHYHAALLNRPILAPDAPHARFAVLALTLIVTVLWGAGIRARVLHHGTRRAVLLLIAMLLLWELDRMVKILTLANDMAFERILWYLFYVFRGGLSVALLWIAWASDEDVRSRSMPPWLKMVFGLNLLLAALILCNDFHHQFFYFIWDAEEMIWQEHLAWGAYAYWTLWFFEILAALLLLLEKAKEQQVLRAAMILPFVLFILFIVYSISFQYVYWVRWAELTSVTALFFLLLVELCLRTGLMPSNRFHEAFFSHSSLHMQLADTQGNIVAASAAPPRAEEHDIRTSRMPIHGGVLIWHEDLRLLHERQRQLALLRDALRRSHALLREEHRIRKELVALTLQKQLSDELEAILESKRPQLRAFREQLMTCRDAEEVTLLIRRLNALSSYLKKRCVLFLKGQEDGRIRADELSMAVSETCTYLRPLGLNVGVEWNLTQPVRTEEGLALFDFFAEFLTHAAQEETEDVFCRFVGGEVPGTVFMLADAPWMSAWLAAWQSAHGVRIVCSDLGYALSLTVYGAQPNGGAAADESDSEVPAWNA